MKKLQCELCGGTLLMDDNGDFASCESCGMKYKRDTIKKMIVEYGGPVQVESIANIHNLLARAREFEESGEVKKAIDYYNRVLDLDMNNSEAKLRYDTLSKPVNIGDLVQVKVIGIKDFGAFVQLPNGCDGLIHISRLDNNRVECVEDAVSLGDVIDAVVIDIDPRSQKISLSRKAAMLKR